MSDTHDTRRLLPTRPGGRRRIGSRDALKTRGLLLVGLGVTMILFAACATSRPFLDGDGSALLGHVVLLMGVPAAACCYVGCGSGYLGVVTLKVASTLLIALPAVASLMVATGELPYALRIAFVCMPTVILLCGVYAAAVAWDPDPIDPILDP